MLYSWDQNTADGKLIRFPTIFFFNQSEIVFVRKEMSLGSGQQERNWKRIQSRQRRVKEIPPIKIWSFIGGCKAVHHTIIIAFCFLFEVLLDFKTISNNWQSFKNQPQTKTNWLISIISKQSINEMNDWKIFYTKYKRKQRKWILCQARFL